MDIPDDPKYRCLEQVSDWYASLRPLLLDLVGDYAGQELFFIEGDSLCRHIFSDKRVSINSNNGPQVVTAIYALERFLSNLRQRGCNFHLVFFEAHKYLCFDQSKTSDKKAWKYILVREAAIQHLQETIPSNNAVKVFNYPSLNDPKFEEYLQEWKPYFALAHDVPCLLPENENKNQQLMQSGILWKLLSQGYNVALLDKVEFRDSKIMSLVAEGTGLGHFTPAFVNKCKGEMSTIATSLSDQYHTEAELVKEEILLDTIKLTKNPHELLIIAAMSRLSKTDWKSSMLVKTCGIGLLQSTLLIQTLSLNQRCLPSVEFTKATPTKVLDFVNTLCQNLAAFISEGHCTDIQQIYPGHNMNYCDLIDVRLFRYCLANPSFAEETVTDDLQRLIEAFRVQSGITFCLTDTEDLSGNIIPKTLDSPTRVAVLPFKHKSFDKHLASIKLDVDDTVLEKPELLYRAAQEKTHWHSTSSLKSEMKVLDKWQQSRRNRSDQIFHTHMQRYAASITGQSAGILEPELIIVAEKEEKLRKGSKAKKLMENESLNSGKPSKNQKGGQKAPTMKKADAIREANMKAKGKKTEDKTNDIWGRVLDELVTLSEKAHTKAETQDAALVALGKISEFQRVKLKGESSTYVYLETRLYRMKVLLELWGNACSISTREKETHKNLAALIFDEARHILTSPALTKAVSIMVKKVWAEMGFGGPVTTSPTGTDKLSTTLENIRVKPGMQIGVSPIEFQLTHSGPYMDRSFGSASDSRVRFQPDTWQRDVLDQIDANKSVFVVAPTSAGKTFISFYAMEKVLKGSNDGILVYVAPTKALVNQIAAEVLARFNKKYPHDGQNVWAIHTRDYRINHPEKCQILITVPHILQILLLAPHNASKWAPRIKRIIFDEIHSIGQADDGVIWEQLLLIAPCPIIALSATVGNPEEFRDWLVETQKAANIDLKMIEHKHRFSDLRKFVYQPPTDTNFTGLDQKRHFEELDDEPNFIPINPISTLIDVKNRALPADLTLEPRDCLEIYKLMKKHQTDSFKISSALDPTKFFSGIIGKADVVKWESALKRELEKWMANSLSPFDAILEELTRPSNAKMLVDTMDKPKTTVPSSASSPSKPNSPSPPQEEETNDDGNDDDAHDNDKLVQDTTCSLLARLHSKNALPAILFSYDRTMVERIVKAILKQLEDGESHFKKTNRKYLAEMEQYQEYVKQSKSKASMKTDEKIKKKQTKKSKNKEDDIEAMKEEQNREEREEVSKWATFDPDAPHEKFLFTGKVNYDVEEDFKVLRNASVPEDFISALRRGIGIHHAGLSRRLREATETLFRMGYLQVVVATGTLALGINMPCKTVGFVGDSVYLTALAYRQCSGRAGRRGFDLFGNVVFHGLSQAKVNRLISSRLPSLQGHFPISTSLVLRMFSLIDGSQESIYSQKAINQLLSQSRLFLGGDSFKEQVLHHLRFSIEYLRRQHLIDARGRPINFAGLVGHLYYTQNSAFAFHTLLKDGVLHTICKDIDKKPRGTALMLMSVMAQIFGRRRCKAPAELGQSRTEIIKRSPSDVYLPPLLRIAREALEEQNEETLKTFTGYAATFAKEYCQNIPDNVLPFTNKEIGSSISEKDGDDTHVRSTFFRISGATDSFASIEDLSTSTRNGVFLESSAIPITDTRDGYWNAYLLDFYKHGSLHPLVVANGLRKNDVWFMLNDFSMILATIVTSIKNFFAEKDVGGSDEDLLELLAMEEGERVDTEEGEAGFGGEDEGDIDVARVNHAAFEDPNGMLKVFKAFVLLKSLFDQKLAAIGATKRPERKGKPRRPRLRVEK
ncbi:hypothetical protein TWF569_011327 [Orbilia oligospora]|uniref:P-loop containing nucleoside triphosphate hydrolase protein n=1 Tax=Orbilia oligospora TaxID=2813651 RepID=A0A7C8JEK3_ORBOL|nr:hypothetical protein TWF103_009518 [Orbilia oligospora]KAF3098121.1 hypothetical protein TWF102_006113 [Orbilia oligospora]KAF3154671.1 hypothetical protein TWF569_011327 [Orbilia oligospora]